MRQGRADFTADFRSPGAAGYLSEDTIVSRISGPGGAVAALRISGPSSFSILKQLCPQAGELEPRRMEKVRIFSRAGAELDSAMAVFFKGPASFTGEDTAEIFLHGGGYITGAVIREILQSGARQALPGEFSFRAVRNGKLTVDQAQAIHDLVSATNASAHGLALERLSGAQSRIFFEIAEELRRLLVLAEAGIDFSDQDLEELELCRLKAPLAGILEGLSRVAASFDRGRRIQEGVSVVIAGLPNAGKSTLFNELLGQERSLISEEAGTTRDVIREAVRLRSSRSGAEATLILHDTAGLREGEGSVERMGIELTRKTSSASDLVVFVVGAESAPAPVLAEWRALGMAPERCVLVLNKSDVLAERNDGAEVRREAEQWSGLFGVRDCIPVSATEHQGVQHLVDELVERCSQWLDREPRETVLTRVDQVEAVERAMESLRRANLARGHDILAADLRQALESLSFFIGATPVDDILGRIFSQFCIGK